MIQKGFQVILSNKNKLDPILDLHDLRQLPWIYDSLKACNAEAKLHCGLSLADMEGCLLLCHSFVSLT